MNISELFIRRPVMTTIVMVGILVFGGMAYRLLPVSDLPNVDFPTISVSAVAARRQPGDHGLVGGDAAREGVLDHRRHRLDDARRARSAARSITLQFALDRDIDAAAQDVQAAIARANRQLPQDMPYPPTYQKVNPADQPILFLALTSPTLPLYQLDEYGQTMIAQRISTVSGVAQVQVYGSPEVRRAHPARPARAGRAAASASTRWRAPCRAPTSTCRPASCAGPTRAYTIEADGQLTDAAGVPADRRRLPRRQAGAARGARPGRRQRRERQDRRLVRRPARDRAGDPAPAGHQHRRGGAPGQGAAADVRAAAAGLGLAGDPLRPLRVDPRVGQRRQVHAAPHPGPGGAGHLPVPAQPLGDRHPLPGDADVDRRHLRRHVPARLLARQPVADGAHAVGRLRRRRRHRHAGEHRPPHGDGQDAAGRRRSTARGRSASRSSR